MVTDGKAEKIKFMHFKEDIHEERKICQLCGCSNNLMVYFENVEARKNLNPLQTLLLCPRCFNENHPETAADELIYFQKKLKRSVYLDEIR